MIKAVVNAFRLYTSYCATQYMHVFAAGILIGRPAGWQSISISSQRELLFHID